MATALTNSNEFYTQLSALKSNHSLIVSALFYADWVEGSSQLIETINALSEEYEDQVKFVLIQADKLTDLATTFEISKLPSVLFFTGNDSKPKKIEAPSNDLLLSTVENLVEEGFLSLDNVEGSQYPQNIDEILAKQKEAMSSAAAGEVIDPQEALNQKLHKLINRAPFMIFIKGVPEAAKCGFSRQLLEILAEQKIKFDSFDILSDEEVRQGLKTYSNWPTFPQMYWQGELLGGLDIFREMISSSELASMNIPRTDSEPEKPKPVAAKGPDAVSPAMAARLKELINSHKIMVFMKGEQTAPRCKFSKLFCKLMTEEGFIPGDGSWGSFNILEDEEVRSDIKIYSDWPTFPQLYVNGELIGGIDVIQEMISNGEFQECLAEAL